uniref:Random slug protein 5 n=1 Tax=Anthurium amnicola TaxID=1678845 RepID=A0A1D1XQI5_9ARAE
MGKEERDRERIEAVLQVLSKQMPLTVKQEKFCTDACVERFLRWKGNSVKKAAKHLRACLAWRDAIGTEHLIADEFSAELAEGAAYVAGHDDEARPVMVFRIKQDYPKFHTQKSYVRLLVFTLEVAVSSMSRFVEQFVLLFDASFFRSASAFLNLFMGTLKIISEYYPGRLHRAFVVDPPSLFSYLWKGVRPFADLWASAALVSSMDLEDSLEDHPSTFASTHHPRAASLRFDPPAVSARGGSTSSRFAFTVSHLDSLKPWYLTRTEPSPAPPPAASPSLAGLSPLNARSFSFATPQNRSLAAARSVPSTPGQQPPRTPRPSFLQSPAAAVRFLGGRREQGPPEGGRGDKGREAFRAFLRFYRRPYDERAYRSKMRPPLGGLISIVSPQMVRHRRHVSHHRF